MSANFRKPSSRDDISLSTLTADARRLRAMQRELPRSTGDKRQKLQADLEKLLAASQAAVSLRHGKLPKPEFQPDLPVNERRADIAGLIAKNQVVIVCGETGSGKTTQLPKICLDLGIHRHLEQSFVHNDLCRYPLVLGIGNINQFCDDKFYFGIRQMFHAALITE
jgi:ATP-dependent helicase HrpA